MQGKGRSGRETKYLIEVALPTLVIMAWHHIYHGCEGVGLIPILHNCQLSRFTLLNLDTVSCRPASLQSRFYKAASS